MNEQSNESEEKEVIAKGIREPGIRVRLTKIHRELVP